MNDQYTADGLKIDVDYELEEYWLKDYKNDRDVRVLVNWNKASAPAKALRFSWPNSRGVEQELIINREELQTIMFLLCPSEQEDQYLRTKTTQLKKQRHQFRMKASRRFEKGEEIVMNKMITI